MQLDALHQEIESTYRAFLVVKGEVLGETSDAIDSVDKDVNSKHVKLLRKVIKGKKLNPLYKLYGIDPNGEMASYLNCVYSQLKSEKEKIAFMEDFFETIKKSDFLINLTFTSAVKNEMIESIRHLFVYPIAFFLLLVLSAGAAKIWGVFFLDLLISFIWLKWQGWSLCYKLCYEDVFKNRDKKIEEYIYEKHGFLGTMSIGLGSFFLGKLRHAREVGIGEYLEIAFIDEDLQSRVFHWLNKYPECSRSSLWGTLLSWILIIILLIVGLYLLITNIKFVLIVLFTLIVLTAIVIAIVYVLTKVANISFLNDITEKLYAVVRWVFSSISRLVGVVIGFFALLIFLSIIYQLIVNQEIPMLFAIVFDIIVFLLIGLHFDKLVGIFAPCLLENPVHLNALELLTVYTGVLLAGITGVRDNEKLSLSCSINIRHAIFPFTVDQWENRVINVCSSVESIIAGDGEISTNINGLFDNLGIIPDNRLYERAVTSLSNDKVTEKVSFLTKFLELYYKCVVKIRKRFKRYDDKAMKEELTKVLADVYDKGNKC